MAKYMTAEEYMKQYEQLYKTGDRFYTPEAVTAENYEPKRDRPAQAAPVTKRQGVTDTQRLHNTYVPATLAQNVLSSKGATTGFNAQMSNKLRSEYNPTRDTYAEDYIKARTQGGQYIPASIGAQIVEGAQSASEARSGMNATEKAYSDLMLNPDFVSGAVKGARYEVIPYTVDQFADLHAYINDTDGRRAKERQRNGPYRNGSIYDFLTESEINVFNYITGTQGKDAAEKYLDDIMPTLNERKATGLYKSIEESESTPLGKVAGTINSVLLAPLTGAGYVGTLIDKAKGKDIDPNASYMLFSGAQNRMRQEASENMGGTAKFFYDVGTSIADVALNAALAGGAGLVGKGAAAATGALMGASAATSVTQDALSRGATDAQAMIAGGIAGIAETALEAVSAKGIFDILGKGGAGQVIDSIRKASGTVVGSIAKQIGTEAGEEAATEVINIITDYLVMGGASNYQQDVYNAVNRGMSLEEAEKQARKNLAIGVGLAALSGAVSGGVMGGGATVINTLTQNAQNQRVTASDVQQAEITTDTQTEAETPVATADNIIQPEVVTERSAETTEQATIPEAMQAERDVTMPQEAPEEEAKGAGNAAQTQERTPHHPLPMAEDTENLLPAVEQTAQPLPTPGQKQQPQLLPSVNEVSETAKTEKESRETSAAPKAAIDRMAIHNALDIYQKAYGITNDARDMASEAAFYVVERIAADGTVPKKAANRAFEILWNAGENIPETVVKEEARQEYLGELERVGMEAHNAVRRAKAENDSAETAERLLREMDAEYREKQRREEDKISAGNAMLEAWRAEPKNKDESRGEREREGRNLSKDLERYKKRQEAEFVDAMESLFEIPKEERESVRKAVSKIGEDIIKTGTLSEEKQASLFKIIWDTGVFYADEANARIAFNDVLFDFRRKMNLVDANARAMERHVREQRKEKKKADAKNLALVKATLKGYKAAERRAAAVETKYGPVLSDGDRAVINALHKGGLTLGEIKGRTNFKEIFAVYKAQQEKMEAQSIIKEFNDTRRKRLHDEAMRALETSDAWKDKKIGLLYERETQERNVRDIVKDPAEAERVVQTYFEPVHENEAEKTRFLNRMNERVKNLKLNKQERQAAQLMGEREDYIERLKDEGVIEKNATSAEGAKPKTKYQKLLLDGYDITAKKLNELRESKGGKINDAKCNEAIKEMRAVYDEFFSMMNDALMRNGYAPIEYRKNYFPHFSSRKGDTAFEELGRALGFNATDADLPTSIAGLTATFKPGKTWFSNALERSGIETDYDIVEGFENYAKGAADIIFHTDDIQRLRALENAIRYKYSDEGRKKRAREITENEDLTPEQRQEMLDAVYKDSDGRTMTSKLSHYAENLTEYTNLLANKKSIADRGAEKRLGRVMYDLTDWVQRRFAGNAIKGSVSVAASNFIPLTQALGGVSPTHLAKGMLDTVKNVAKKDGFADRSDFITNRRGVDSLTKTAVQKAGDALTKPLDMVDDIVSEAIVRARYQKNIKDKMSEAEAMRDADRFAANVMADRSKGATPTIFGEKNPLAKMFTTFQIEVNNQLSFLLKDVPKDSAEGKAKAAGIAAAAHAFFKIFLAAFLYNELDEKVTGRRRTLDPVGIVKQAIEDGLAVEAGEMKAFDAASRTWEAVMGNVPFIGSALGGDGGRSPAAGALPDVGALAKTAINAIEDGEVDAVYVAQEALDELKKPLYYLLPPFAGGQIKKTIEGIQAVNRGGSFKTDKEGNLKMQFRTDQKFGDYLQAGLFGKWSLPEAREYVDQGFPILSAKDTQAYLDATENGIDGATFLSIRDTYKNLEPTKENGKTTESTTEKFRKILFNDKTLTPEQKQLVDAGLIRNESGAADYTSKERFDLYMRGGSAYDNFLENVAGGMSEAEAYRVENWRRDYKDLETIEAEDGTKIGPKQQIREQLLEDKTLTPEQKQTIDRALFGDAESYTELDYSDPDRFMISQLSPGAQESAAIYERRYNGNAADYVRYYDLESRLENDKDSAGNTVEGSAREKFRQELFDDKTLSADEKAALDNLITGSNARSYESEFAFTLSGMGGKCYERAQAYVAGGVSEDDALAVEQWMKANKNFTKDALGDYMEYTLGMTSAQRHIVYKTRWS